MKLSTAIVLALLLTPMGVFAWEEQIEGCRLRGIPPSECPDDESFVGVPYEPPMTPSSDRGVSGGHGRSWTHRVWVLDNYWPSGQLVCYNAHYRLIREHNGWRELIDFTDRTTSSCVLPAARYIPDLVLE